MKKLLVRLLLVLAGVAGLSIPANAQALVDVKIPFQFVAGGQTLPAVEYKISLLNDWDSRVLLLSSRENHVGVVLSKSRSGTRVPRNTGVPPRIFGFFAMGTIGFRRGRL